jgi:vesicle transport through interaction with t-SNAREs protein 1
MQPMSLEGGKSRQMTIFRTYEARYKALVRSLNRHIDSYTSLPPGSASSPPTNDAAAESDFKSAESAVKGMELEVRSMQGDEKKRSMVASRQYRSDLDTLRRNFEAARAQAKDTKFSPGHSLGQSRVGDLLMDSAQVLADTESIGGNVMGDLESQRESLLRSHQNVRETGGFSDRSGSILRSMERRYMRTKLVLYGIIVALCCAIILVLYIKLTRR